MALKACKECKKEISTDAKSCPNCGKKSPHGMGLLAKVGLGFFGFVVLSAVVGGNKNSNASQASMVPAAAAEPPQVKNVESETPALPPLEVDAMQLWRDYDANEVSADNMYKDRSLAVTGRVASIDKDFLDNIIIHLRSPNQFMHTRATMEDSEKRAASS